MTQHERPGEIRLDPKWVTPTSVKVLRPFCVKGQRQEAGTVVSVPFTTAMDLVALRKAELVSPG